MQLQLHLNPTPSTLHPPTTHALAHTKSPNNPCRPPSCATATRSGSTSSTPSPVGAERRPTTCWTSARSWTCAGWPSRTDTRCAALSGWYPALFSVVRCSRFLPSHCCGWCAVSLPATAVGGALFSPAPSHCSGQSFKTSRGAIQCCRQTPLLALFVRFNTLLMLWLRSAHGSDCS